MFRGTTGPMLKENKHSLCTQRQKAINHNWTQRRSQGFRLSAMLRGSRKLLKWSRQQEILNPTVLTLEPEMLV